MSEKEQELQEKKIELLEQIVHELNRIAALQKIQTKLMAADSESKRLITLAYFGTLTDEIERI